MNIRKEDDIDHLYQLAVDYFTQHSYEVSNGSNSNTDFGHSRYFYVNQNGESKEHSGLGFQIRVSDHSVLSNRRINEFQIYNKADIESVFHTLNFYFHPEEYSQKDIIVKKTVEIEVGENELRGSDIVLSERVAKSGRKRFQVKRTYNNEAIVATHSKSGYKMPIRMKNHELRFAEGGKVKKLIEQGVVDLKIYDTTPEHAREYGLEGSNPLYIQRIFVNQNERNNGLGEDVFKYIDEYAKANKHDLIFGHIQQNAEPSVNAIKIMIRKNGYSTIEGNNDFYKYVKVNSKYNDGGMTWSDYVKTQFNEEQDKYLPSGYLDEFEVKSNTKKDYPILLKVKNGLEYRLVSENSSIIGVFDADKQVADADDKVIQVAKSYQKKGIGLELVTILKERNSNHRFGSMTPEGWNLMGKYYDSKIANNYNIRFDDGREMKQESLKIIIKNVTNSNKYSGAYKKIFDIIEEDITFYSPYGTESEDLIGNDFHIIITPRPEQGLIEKIRKIKNVVIVDDGYAKGGSIKRYKKDIMNKIKKGGITYGKSHAEGGIPVKNASTGDMLEVEGGEGIVNKRSMASGKKVKLNGKEMSLCEAVSELNQIEGGVQFNCDDVADRQFLEEMALGGELERGTRTEKEHIQVLKDLYAKRITPDQATKKIAKDHLKEDKRYYSKLAKMEGKMAKGGMITDADGLKGHIVKFYEAGVKDPFFSTVTKAYYSDPSFRFKTLSIDFIGGGTEVLSEGQIEAFLKGEQVQMKTQGKYDFYAIQLTPRKMKNGGQTADCGCGSTYAEGGFVEDKSPLEIGDVVYVIDNAKPRNEWLRGVYVEKSGNNAKVVITDADANQYEKTISFDKLIKLDIAQANPSDFKLFNQEFTKAKDSYFESLSKIGIIEERINRAKLFPDPDPAQQKKILADLKDELSKAEKFKSTASGNLSDVKDVPSAFYRYAEGGVVTIDKIYETISIKNNFEFNLGKIKTKDKFENKLKLFLADLGLPKSKRENPIASYIVYKHSLPTTTINFEINENKRIVTVDFTIAKRNLKKDFDFSNYTFILEKLGFKVGGGSLDFGVFDIGKSKRFHLMFYPKYFTLFEDIVCILDTIDYLKVSALMCLDIPDPYLGLENDKGGTIYNMSEVLTNGKILENESSSSSGGSSGDDSDKIKEFLQTYDESKNPSAFVPKKGESEVSGILNRIVENKLISKQEWDDCVQRAINTKELYDKIIQYGDKTSVVFKVLSNRVVELATANTEKALSLMYAYEKLITPKFTKEEMIDFPVLMMMIWEHKPPLDSSIFE